MRRRAVYEVTVSVSVHDSKDANGNPDTAVTPPLDVTITVRTSNEI